jgi:polysaccharide export outer membrane protein
MIRRTLALILGSFLLLRCAGPGDSLPALPDNPQGEYRLGPGDQLRIITFAEEQLTGEFRVNDRGTISLPLVGAVPAAGATPAELEVRIADALKRGALLREPSVSVEVTGYRPIFILGEVARPGQYPYQPGMTVVTAVSVAGGFTYRAIEDQASIIRSTDGRVQEARAGRQSYVAPGDVITVYERRF